MVRLAPLRLMQSLSRVHDVTKLSVPGDLHQRASTMMNTRTWSKQMQNTSSRGCPNMQTAMEASACMVRVGADSMVFRWRTAGLLHSKYGVGSTVEHYCLAC